MFNKQTPENQVGQQGPSQPELPPLRLFRVRRHDPESGLVEEILVEAHSVNFNTAGNVLQFGVFAVDPYRGPTEFIRRCFNGWIDYEEELRYTQAPGRLVIN